MLCSPAGKSPTCHPAGRIRQKARGKNLRGGGLKLRSGYALPPVQAAAFPRLILIVAEVSS